MRSPKTFSTPFCLASHEVVSLFDAVTEPAERFREQRPDRVYALDGARNHEGAREKKGERGSKREERRDEQTDMDNEGKEVVVKGEVRSSEED